MLKTSIPPDAFPTDLNEQAVRSCALFFFIAQFVLPCSIDSCESQRAGAA